MNKSIRYVLVSLVLWITCTSVPAQETANPYIGRWALTIPGGGAGWLGVTQEDGYLDAGILWGGGSVVPVASVYVDNDTLVVTRVRKVERKDDTGETIRTHTLTETIIGNISGDMLELEQIRPHSDGKGADRRTFAGKRIPPLPPKPDLSRAKYGKPIVLFNGDNLDGWKLTDPSKTNGWSVEDGVLVNRPVQHKGKPHVSYGNLCTVDKFEDFNLKFEVNVPEKGNSGVYLRGIYEVQVSDSHGKDPDSHNMGAIYSRIKPSMSAEKPAGQWQTMNITLLDRHVTVELNGKVIIDNGPLLGCTGGALWSDESRPGPIYLQGDHKAVDYRNIVLTPIIKSEFDQQAVVFEEKLNLAGIGVGNMGMGNVDSLSSENIAAVCDVDENYAAKTFKQYPQAKEYRDFRKMLGREKNIDGVIVATPDHTHFIISMTAILQGKHLYCEKPLTQTVEQAQRVADDAVITAGEKIEVMIRCQHDPGRLAGAKGRKT